MMSLKCGRGRRWRPTLSSMMSSSSYFLSPRVCQRSCSLRVFLGSVRKPQPPAGWAYSCMSNSAASAICGLRERPLKPSNFSRSTQPSSSGRVGGSSCAQSGRSRRSPAPDSRAMMGKVFCCCVLGCWFFFLLVLLLLLLFFFFLCWVWFFLLFLFLWFGLWWV